MADALPTAKVYMAFDGSTWQTPEASISWTEVTAAVSLKARIRTRRGRSSELDRFTPGTAAFTLICRMSRDFDPDYASSPYVGDIVPGVPVKITGTYDAGGGAVVYPRFRGFVDDWPQDHDLANVVVSVPITATDGFGILARQDLPSGWYELVVLGDAPKAYWRLSEQRDGDVMVDSSGNGADGIVENATFGLDSLVGDPNDKAISTEHTAEARGQYHDALGLLPAAPPVSWECLVQVVRASGESKILWAVQRDFSSNPLTNVATVFYPTDSPNGELVVGGYRGGANRWTFRGSTRIDDGLIHHILVVFETTTSIKVYVDGVAETLTNILGASPILSWVGDLYTTVGNTVDRASGDFGLGGTIDEMAVYDYALNATQALAHALTAFFGGSTSGSFRIGQILDYIGWPALQRDLSAFDVEFGTADFGLGSNALDELQRIDMSEQGRQFIGADGKLVQRNRFWYLNTQTAAACTLSDDGAPGAVRYSRFSKRMPRDLIRNIVSGSRAGGPELKVRDDPSIVRYGAAEHSLSGLYGTSDTAVRATLDWILSRYKDPHVRLDAITVPIHGAQVATHAPAMLALELDDRISVERTPMGIGSQDVYSVSVDSIEDDIGEGTWDVTVVGSPIDTETSFGLWGTGLWDSAQWA